MRQAHDRAKLTTAVGILTMLFGAMFVLAPAAGAQGNPAGNNGFVQIDGLGPVDGPGRSVKTNDPENNAPDNDPHIACGVQLEFFNFDIGQTADVIFYARPPTGEFGVAEQDLGVDISGDDAAGGSDDLDLVKTYTLDPSAFTSTHETQGWHVSLDVVIYDSEGAEVPGAQKHKTFWFVNDCEEEPPGGCVDDPETVGDECNPIPPCEDDLTTPADECNPEIPTPDPASLTVVKAVAGDDAPDDWTFPFTITNLGDVDLTDEDSDFSEIELDAGNYTITESDAGDADLTDISCSVGADVTDTDIAADGSTGSVTVALDEGDAVTCTFTNTFPDVEGSVVTNPPKKPVTPTTGPAVLGEQVVRTLPRTGSTNGPLAVLGVALLLVGATLVGGSRLRLRYVD